MGGRNSCSGFSHSENFVKHLKVCSSGPRSTDRWRLAFGTLSSYEILLCVLEKGFLVLNVRCGEQINQTIREETFPYYCHYNIIHLGTMTFLKVHNGTF